MQKKYLTGVIISVLVLGCNQIFIQYWLQKKTHDAQVINIAGRQRMLSQRINLELYKIHNGHTNSNTLDSLQSQWLKAHYALLNGDDDFDINGVEDATSKELLTNLTPIITRITNTLHQNPYLREDSLTQMTGELSSFLNKMDLAVGSLENNANKKLTFIIIIEIVLALISILVIVCEVRFIYRPISKILEEQLAFIKRSEEELKVKNAKLRRIAQIQSHKLRRPLANILGLIHLIKFDDRNEFNPLYLEKLKKSAEELDETIATIVSHTKTVEEDI